MGEESDEIKSRLDIVDIIQSYVILKKAGNNWKGLCPFHSEKTPSFMVSREKQIFKCFGCSEGGDVFAFLMKMENLEFPEALTMLAERAGVTLSKRSKAPSEVAQGIAKNRLYELNRKVAWLYHSILTRHPQGQPADQYLKQRGVNDQSIKKYLLGFAPAKPVVLSWLTKQGFSVEEARVAGSPDRFTNRIMFPFHDPIGNIIGFSGRAIGDDQQPKYLHTAETALFHKSQYIYGLHQARQAIKTTGSVVIVEGQLDVILSSQAGIESVVCMSGTALTDQQIRILSRYTDTVLLSYDADSAGQKATDDVIRRLVSMGRTVKALVLPSGFKDAGEIVQHDAKLWVKTVRDARQVIDWLIETAGQGQLSIEQKKVIAQRILPVLALMPDPIEQAHWVGITSQRLRIPQESVVKALASQSLPPTPQMSGQSPSLKLSVNELLLALFEKLPEKKNQHDGLYQKLNSCYTKDKTELVLLFDHLHALLTEPALIEEFEDSLKRYHLDQVESIKQNYAQAIATAEESGDRQKAKELVKKLMEELEKSNVISQPQI